MVAMAQNPPTPPGSPSEAAPAVVEWGDADAPPHRPSAPGGPRRDRAVVLLVAGLGALALFASLLSDWQSTTISTSLFRPPEAQSAGSRVLQTSVGDLDAWGSGYLAGLVALVGATAVLLFGPPAAAHLTRVLSLSTAAVLLALLTGLAVDLGQRSMALDNLAYLGEIGTNRLDLGRGITCAFIGVAALALAAQLSRRLTARPAAPIPPGTDGLTVEATAPFIAGPDDPGRLNSRD
jgi:hypothetical protein